RSTQWLIQFLSDVAKNWLRPDYPLRRLALQEGQHHTGFSRQTIGAGLDGFFRHVTEENLRALLEQDLGTVDRLDQFKSVDVEQRGNRASVVTAPELLVHITAGNVPNPTLMSMLLGVLLKSAQFIKCASGAAALPRLFAHSLYEAEPKLGACLEIAEWRGGKNNLEQALYDHADCVTATGSDETLAEVARRVPARARFIGYGHQVSFGFVSAEVLTDMHAGKIIERAAADVTAWNQLGCLSPHVFYVEDGGAVLPHQFAERLAKELEKREQSEPRGELPVPISSAIASRRSIYEMRAAHSEETRLWSSPHSTSWTVVFEADPQFQLSCLHRFIYVKRVAALAEALQGADVVRGKVSTVGLAVPEHQAQGVALQLARWGATRVCPLGQMQNPPLTWRHDGRPALGDLVVWTDWEQ
ncbi:MAG TPA: acyl-CoA reductase, partial [Clostridia bacterium]|nr:acyl-CoA reductase [Clostridia bacterium]